MEFLYFILGTLLPPLVLALSLKINAEETIKALASAIAKYLGMGLTNELTNITALVFVSIAYSLLVAIEDNEDLSEIASKLYDIREELKRKLAKKLS